jgi:hypothetical protein
MFIWSGFDFDAEFLFRFPIKAFSLSAASNPSRRTARLPSPHVPGLREIIFDLGTGFGLNKSK